MIQSFVDQFMASKSLIEQRFRDEKPIAYSQIVKVVIEALNEELDPERIYEIKDGDDHSGKLIYVIGERSLPEYCYIAVNYGSCSVCDTLRRVQEENESNESDETTIKDLMTLALHIVQGLKEMD